MDHILFFIFVVLSSVLLAKVEIQIEGKDGYAQSLPVTWRTKNKWVKNLIGGTSYHVYMWAFILALMHLPFVVGLPWTPGKEMLIISFLLFITVVEDFLWFILNPDYGIKKYKKECIPWFQDRWIWFTPAWYWWYTPIAILLYLGSRMIA